MTASHTYPSGRFYRNADKAMLGGVCAGIADYLGFNLKVTRILAFIAFLMVMPVAVVAYFAIVFLVPSTSTSGGKVSKRKSRRARRKDKAAAAEREFTTEEAELADTIDEKCRAMDRRLAQLEQHVTSRRFQLDQEFRNL